MSFCSDHNPSVNSPLCSSHIAATRPLCSGEIDDKVFEIISYRSTLACQSIKKLAYYLCPLRTTLLYGTLIICILAHVAGIDNFEYSRLCKFTTNLIL